MNLGGSELFVIGFVLLVAVAPIVLILWFASRATRRPMGPAATMTVPGATTTVVQPPPLGPAGRWYADPTGRFAQRWWDGGRWTADVVLANGQQSADPAALPDPPPPPPA